MSKGRVIFFSYNFNFCPHRVILFRRVWCIWVVGWGAGWSFAVPGVSRRWFFGSHLVLLSFDGLIPSFLSRRFRHIGSTYMGERGFFCGQQAHIGWATGRRLQERFS